MWERCQGCDKALSLFGREVCYLAQWSKHTIPELADLIDMDHVELCAILSGEKRIPGYLIKRVSQALRLHHSTEESLHSLAHLSNELFKMTGLGRRKVVE